jgi:hypothetical protein
MNRAVQAYRLAGVLLALGMMLWVPSAAQAGGPGTGGRRVRLEDTPAGPYRLRALTSPTPPRVENLYVEVRVSDGATQAVLTDVTVWVTAVPTQGEGRPLTVEATRDIAPVPDEYAAHLPLDSAGVWEITIRVDGRLGAGQASFLERVAGRASLSGWVAVGAPLAGLLALGLLFWKLQRATGSRPN